MIDRLESEVRIEATGADERQQPHAPSAPEDEFSIRVREISPETKLLISRCIEGTEPFDRELQSWEPDKLSPKAAQAVIMRASGFKQVEIAKLLDMKQQTISVLCNHPYGRKIISAMLHEQGSRVLDIKAKLEQHANDMLDRMTSLALMENDLNLVQKVAFGLLDRSGHGPQQRIEVDSKASKTLSQDVGTLKRLTSALEQSQSANRVSAHFTQKPPPADAPIPGTASREAALDFSDDLPHRSNTVPSAGLQLSRKTGTDA